MCFESKTRVSALIPCVLEFHLELSRLISMGKCWNTKCMEISVVIVPYVRDNSSNVYRFLLMSIVSFYIVCIHYTHLYTTYSNLTFQIGGLAVWTIKTSFLVVQQYKKLPFGQMIFDLV